MLKHYFKVNHQSIEIQTSLYSCLFIWDSLTNVDTARAQEPSMHPAEFLKFKTFLVIWQLNFAQFEMMLSKANTQNCVKAIL